MAAARATAVDVKVAEMGVVAGRLACHEEGWVGKVVAATAAAMRAVTLAARQVGMTLAAVEASLVGLRAAMLAVARAAGANAAAMVMAVETPGMAWVGEAAEGWLVET